MLLLWLDVARGLLGFIFAEIMPYLLAIVVIAAFLFMLYRIIFTRRMTK